ncbi:hypothetical protein [Mycolicibacterium nivoides]|uniref:hypothetical protein n=1 Tax=Mycolicibacterium nivoides TaxID=2487344 RepID=UPI003C2E8DE8
MKNFGRTVLSVGDRHPAPIAQPSANMGADRLLSLRAAVILLFAVLMGTAVGALAYVGGKELALAILAGVGAVGATAVGLDKLIAA